MLDLEHFKNFNDTYGHDAGDAVLRETASFHVRSIRAEDFVCRYGGEEFVIVLPTADLRAAEARAKRIRAELRDLVIMHNGPSLGLITASIGVAALPAHGTSEKICCRPPMPRSIAPSAKAGTGSLLPIPLAVVDQQAFRAGSGI
jgi:diguanylate cyclase (GGDEF)-like protein